jgi:acyl carrier protein
MTKPASRESAAAADDGFDAGEIRALIAEQLGVDIARVTDEAHFSDDLGADWLDRVELMLAIEDRFVEVEISDDDADQICAVGDLIHHIESVMAERTVAIRGHRRGVTPAIHELWGARRARPAWKMPSAAGATIG